MPGNQKPEPFVLTGNFDGQDLSNDCTVYLPENGKTSKDDVLNFPAFKDWLKRLLYNLQRQEDEAHEFHSNKYRLTEIDVQAADWFTKTRLGFLKIQAKVENGAGESLPGAVFLRGGSVGILLILEAYDPKDPQRRFEQQTIVTIQPRIASGSLALAEIPAGMLDGKGDFAGKAADELKEEVGIEIKEDDLFDMSKLATEQIPTYPWAKGKTPGPLSESIENSMYPSAGGCDEFLPLMLCQKRLTVEHMEKLDGKKTGLRKEGERIRLRLVPLKDLWKEGGRDAKALAALALYESLKREGWVPSMPTKPDA
ncbi:NUDIX family hydrolase [Lentithecium fluviatile CBS 122367]|uniref:NUDIX family hydrolase n=1 Tax=Lentithecium fluviatile CBS 122367 TaxID=1168545 RepID=A0A6G1J7A2_9PLEO|nr:NUDIX family hydrolase [Lentithecium fluviatile CBS 122367]